MNGANRQDFDKWNEIKKLYNELPAQKYPQFGEREVWFASLGKNIGYEQDGKGELFLRPVLIIKKFNKEAFLAVPLTSASEKKPFRISVGRIRGKDNSAIISQVRFVSAARLRYRIGKLKTDEYEKIKDLVANMISTRSAEEIETPSPQG